jgi:glycosyltransferase involved in cell wall biosynthesis
LSAVYIDVTSSCKAAKNTGMQRMTRGLYRHLSERLEVTPISWNKKGARYQQLGARELQVLRDPFRVRSKATVRPEWYGETRTEEWFRLFFRKTIDLEKEMRKEDILLIPDFYNDARTSLLPRVIDRTGVYSVAIFHDAAALRSPQLADRDRIKFHNYLRSLAAFDLVICISDETREDLLQRWRDENLEPARTVVEAWPVEFNTDVVKAENETVEPIIACIGSFERRKNHSTLLRAAEKLWEHDIDFELQLVGRTTHHSAPKLLPVIWRLERRGRRLRWLRHINDELLHEVYRSCRFTVYPSLMEGFGLPIAESLWHGKPVVCGGNGALGEIARGGGCLIVDQTSVDALADGIKSLLLDNQLYSRLCAEARARKFRSWSDYTAKLLQHLQRENQPMLS